MKLSPASADVVTVHGVYDDLIQFVSGFNDAEKGDEGFRDEAVSILRLPSAIARSFT